MKRFFSITLLILTIFALTSCSNNTEQPIYHTAQGDRIRLSDYHGKWLILNYWSVHCTSCIHEIPELNKFYNTYKNKAAVLGVNFDEPPLPILKQAIKKFNIQFPVLVENPASALNIKIAYMPTTIIINPQGKIVATLVGPQTEHSLVESLRL